MEAESKQPTPSSYKKPALVAAFIVVLITLIIFLPALWNGFVNWDDHLYVSENQHIRALDFEFLRWSLTASVASLWHPLTMFSLAIDQAVWGLNPSGYHFTNILFHSLNTFLVFVSAVRLTGYVQGRADKKSIIASIATAVLFGIHPLRVESVVWVSERKDVLCAFFFLLSLISYLRYASSRSKKPLFYAASLIFFALALMSKPMAVSLPVVLMILDFYPLKRWAAGYRGILAEKLPFFALSVLSTVVTIWIHHLEKALLEGTLGSVEPFLFTVHVAVRAFIFYLTKMLMPFNLSPLYPRPVRIDPFSFEYIGSFTLLLLITCIVALSLRSTRLYLSIWLYYIVTLIPVIGLVPIGSHAAADRYTYLPSIGFFLLVGVGVGYLFERYSKKSRVILAAALIFLFVPLAINTLIQIPVWENPVTLWSRVIMLFPYSTKAYIKRGGAYVDIGDHWQALKDLDIAVKLDPLSLKAHLERGNAYNKLGRYQEAINDYSKAIEINSLEGGEYLETIKAYVNRGVAYMAMGDYQSAVKDSNEAIRLDPAYAKAYNLRGAIFVNMGNYREAIKGLDMAIKLDPISADGYYNRGSVHRILGDNHRAIDDFSTAIRLNPQYAEAYNNRGNAYGDLGRYREAIEDYNIAIKLNPQDTIAYRNREVAYKNLDIRSRY